MLPDNINKRIGIWMGDYTGHGKGTTMKKTAADLYPQEEYGDYGDYQPMLDSFGNIVVQHDEKDYQGSTWCLYKDSENKKYGYLCFGWGSCSGCDALQACSSIEEIQQLMDRLEDSISWLTRQEMKGFLAQHDWEGDCCGDDGFTFAKQALSFLFDQDIKELF